MPKADSSLNMLIVAAVVALGVGYYVPQTFSQSTDPTQPTATHRGRPKAAPPKAAWAASAPGRVEPIGRRGAHRRAGARPHRRGAGRRSTTRCGRRLLVRLDDEELIARVHAARAEVAVRKRDRDNETVGKPAQDRRTAEDNVANAERSWCRRARSSIACSRARRSERHGRCRCRQGSRCSVKQATERLDQARAGSAQGLAVDNLPAPTRLEAAWPRHAPNSRWPKRRWSARASGRPPPAPCCRSTPASARRPRRRRKSAGRRRRRQRAAGQGRDRGARHRQDARRPDSHGAL